MSLEAKLQQLSQIAASPAAQLARYLEQGKKVIGCFPVYTPEPIAYAAGMIPLGLWGADVEPFQAKRYVPAFCCPIMQADLELGLQGTYKGISGVMIPTLCDTFRCITQNWKAGVQGIPMIPITYPQNRTEAGLHFLAGELGLVKKQLEEIGGKPITEADLQAAIAVYNEHSRTMMRFARAANDHLDVITPALRHAVMKSAWFMDKQEHTALVKELLAELEQLPVHKSNTKRVLLTGILAEPVQLYEVLQENGISVVGDDLAQESRQYRTLIPESADGLQSLALQWKDTVCSLAHDENKTRVTQMVEQAKETGANGVIACMMKFCDPEEYDFPLFSKALRGAGVPTLYLEIDLHAGSVEQARTRIQTFSEMF